jgi:hypothetical protein
MPLLQLYENISGIYFRNCVHTFIAESLDSYRNHLQEQQLIGVMMKWFLMFLLS